MGKILPYVSIVMTAYNEEQYIGEGIASVQAQTFEDWELIVVDDGSQDRTRECVTEYAQDDDRIRLVESQHVGRAEALNIGLEHAEGSLIAILDADDQARVNRLELQVQYFADHPAIDVVGGGCHFYEEERGREWTWVPPQESKEIRRYALRGMPLPHTTIMFRRHILSVVAGYRDRDYEDYDFIIRTLRHFTATNLQQVLVDVRVHGNSIMGSMHAFAGLRETLRSRLCALKMLCPKYLLPLYAPISFGAVIGKSVRLFVQGRKV